MRIPFAVWSGVVALIVYAALMALEYRNFGAIEPLWGRLGLIVAVWLGLVVLVGLFNQVRRAATPRPADVPPDVEREIDAHR